MVIPKREASPCKVEHSDSEAEKEVDVEEFSDGENVSASSPSALSCEEDHDAEEEDADDAKSKSDIKSGKRNGKKKSRPEPVNHAIKPRCNCDELLPVDCQLETKELWDKFHELGTEMIITKTGRSVNNSLNA